MRLSFASERLLAAVRGRLMRKHKASGGLVSAFVCVGSVEVRMVGRVSHRNHTGLHECTNSFALNKLAQKESLHFHACRSLHTGCQRLYLQKIN